MFTQQLVNSVAKHLPAYTPLASRLQRELKLLSNSPVELSLSKSNRIIIKTLQNIYPNTDIFLLAANECFFSTDLQGAVKSQKERIFEKLQLISTQYDSMNKQFMQKLKIYLQVIANSKLMPHTVSMPLEQYANIIINSPSGKSIKKQEINSRFLLHLYESNKQSNTVTFQYLQKEMMRSDDMEKFIDICNKTKMIIRQAEQSSILFCAPLLDKLDHSFTPNCLFDLVYLAHRRLPFVRIKSKQFIPKDSRLTYSYGAFNNYQLFFRCGFTVDNNPYDFLILPINYEVMLQQFPSNIEWKQKLFLQNGLKLKGYIRIDKLGKIKEEDLRLLRIVANESKEPSCSELSNCPYDKQIYAFLLNQTESFRRWIKINNLKKTTDPDALKIEVMEFSILQRLLDDLKQRMIID